jgi:hypothetical protein
VNDVWVERHEWGMGFCGHKCGKIQKSNGQKPEQAKEMNHVMLDQERMSGNQTMTTEPEREAEGEKLVSG